MKQSSLITLLAIMLLIATNAESQMPIKSYEAAWEKVEALRNKNLSASALTEVKKIYTQAKTDKQDAQIIKCLIYFNWLQNDTREDNEQRSINETEKEIADKTGVTKALLYGLLASQYRSYFENNRWRIYQRTETKDFKKDDIATWALNDFHEKITELHLLSLKEKRLLQSTSLDNYEVIIDKGNVRHLRPTVYDLLAFQALNYFVSSEGDINKPADAFHIDQASAFDPAADFVHRKFTTKDTTSPYYKALLIFQDLLAFHLNDSKPDALIDADLIRYQFVNHRSIHPNKAELYYNGINHIAHQYGHHPAAAQAWYLLAEYHNRLGMSYNALGDTSHRFEKITAREIAEKIIAQKDSSEGKINASNLLAQLLNPSLNFEIENVNLPGKPFRCLIEYRNIRSVHLRIIKATDALKKLRQEYPYKLFWKAAVKAAPLHSQTQEIPDTKDLQLHRVEIKIESLPSGEYYLIASSDPSFTESAISAAEKFYVSAISYINNEQDYYVLNRENGQPLRSAKVQVWRQEYDYKLSKNVTLKDSGYITDENGHFHLKQIANNGSYYNLLFEISTKDDYLFMDNPQPEYARYKTRTSSKTEIFLFTDRGIYRPGQTIYFKGIVLSREARVMRTNIAINYNTTIHLRQPNGQNIDSLNVTTNEFGSFSGKFRLPSAGITGSYALATTNERLYKPFSVEEYKRPKFHVEYESLKSTYRINDSITVTGLAKAYAGNNISGAIVKYRVERRARFLYPWLFRTSWLPISTPQEIAHGETITDDGGKFAVKFKAIPDASIDENTDPSFDYVVYADITDINGETRSGTNTVSVSYKSLLLNVQIPERMPADSLTKINIRTENNNGEFEPALVTVKIFRLKAENRLIRNRLWRDPDQFIYTKEEYLRYFPHDRYDRENELSSWEKEDRVFEKADSTKRDKLFSLDGMTAESGTYVIEIFTKDRDGKEVKDLKYITLYNSNDKKPEQAIYFLVTDAAPTEPGETAKIEIASTADNLFIIQQVQKRVAADSISSTYSFIKLANQKKMLRFDVKEADRGGFAVNWTFIKHNQFFNSSKTINVPWSNKELNIEYASFRDKTLPGGTEHWKLKISGLKSEAVAAELLAGMYDASLDQFRSGAWYKPGIWPVFSSYSYWKTNQNFRSTTSWDRQISLTVYKELKKEYDRFIFGYWDIIARELDNAALYGSRSSNAEVLLKSMPSLQMDTLPQIDPNDPSRVMRYGAVPSAEATLINENKYASLQTDEMFDQGELVKKPEAAIDENIQLRKNFNETAFFFPDLKTDSTGAIEFSFTMPEALTRWKFQALVHTKDLAFGYTSKEIITQKELMVQPNAPRFLREADRIVFNAKIVNLSEKQLNGNAELQLFNAATNQPVDILFNHTEKNKSFNLAPGQSVAVYFPLSIPNSYAEALTWRIVARAENFADGEENILPVLSNRMLVTETISLPMRGNESKQFDFEKLKQSSQSNTLQQHSLTVEYTSNTAWYAVQALPYLMEYPYDCVEQTWNRYYANSLASSITNTAPKLRQVFEQWKTTDTAALLSSLEKNPELKSILLEETPWVLTAKTEAERKQHIALLFDMIKMSEELNNAYEKLKQLQSSNGGFVWFKGGPDDRYMTQYIVTAIGHLQKLKAVNNTQSTKLQAILSKAIPYLDRKMKEDYDNLVKNKTDLKKYVLDYQQIQYFYMRSFFPDRKIDVAAQKAYNYFKSQLKADWTKRNKYMQGMTALALHRLGDKITPVAILTSLKQTSINHEELGMYWKDTNRGWWWYESPIERQAILIEAFNEISKDTKTVDDLRTWLLRNKQTNSWESTKATAEACYALLLQGTNWFDKEPVVNIQLGDILVKSSDSQTAEGTGYFSKTFQAHEVKPDMGNIAVTVSSSSSNGAPSWGGVYWQYFEDIDKITVAATPLQLQKKLFIETNSDRGPVLSPVNKDTKLKIGDKLKVRIELRVDRDMEYVHMKDMRASALEPVNVLSSYKWQGELGYYESTGDVATNFFFSNLRKGTYVFEYAIFVSHSGNFTNGITTIQCMYAPEFSAHSEGTRIIVE